MNSHFLTLRAELGFVQYIQDHSCHKNKYKLNYTIDKKLRCLFNFTKKVLSILFLFSIQFLSSCSQLPLDNNDIRNETIKLLIKTLKSQVETVFNDAAPINPVERSSYPKILKLPGGSFDPRKNINRELVYDFNGNLLLSPGDYVIPVMTYCMKQARSSPSGHIYSLSKLEGTRAEMIRELNLLAPTKFNKQDIQIVSWSLQAGLAYDEMTKESQKIIDEVIPQFKLQLKESFLSVLEKKWNKLSNNSHGLIPSFEESSENLFTELGEVGKKIIVIRRFKNQLHKVGNDYSRLSELINTASLLTKIEAPETAWSQISSNIYSRFITAGHYQEIGFIQIRILKENQKRVINSVSRNDVVFDLVSLIANPNSNSVQPLTFSPIYGYAVVMILPDLVKNPLAATMVLAAVLAAKTIEWDSFFKLYDLLKDSNYSSVKQEIEIGMRALQEAHDELEKPLKEAGIISGKTKETSNRNNGEVKNYTKSGGGEQLQRDFDKLPGKNKVASDGSEYKELPDGKKIVKRPAEDETPPTLEVQYPKGESRGANNIRIKVRYL